jgi:hypothetical protein
MLPVFVGLLLLGIPSPTEAAIILNEFMARNTKTNRDDLGLYSDWVELYNNSASPASAAGYYLTDATSQPTKWRIPSVPAATIPGGGHLVIWVDGTHTPNPAHPLHASFKMNGTDGETIALYSSAGTTITGQVIHYGQQAPDVSYGRTTVGGSIWGPFKTATPGARNQGYVAPPASLAGIVFINEWLTSNTTGIRDLSGKREDWFELYNARSNPLDLGGYYLTDDLTRPTRWRIPAGNVIGPFGFALFWADKDPEEGPTHADFKLNDSTGAIGMYKDSNTPINTITYGRQRANISQGRLPDGAPPPFRSFSTPTPGESNVPRPTRAQSWESYR